MAMIKDNVTPLAPIELAEAEASIPIWELIASSAEEIPLEERAKVPHDGARNYKHYLYGQAKEAIEAKA